PELGFEERRTSDVVRRLLEDWGVPFVDGLAGTGIVGVLKKGQSTRALGLRADMDALPIVEDNTFAHASRHDGRMHACGHDGHTAMLLAAAKHLAHNVDFDGVIYLIFQPAEERGAGASRMIADGLFERFPMEAVFGAHNWPNLEVGAFAVSPGPMMASCNEFTIDVIGSGGHAAMPDLCIDPVQPACQIAGALQTIVSRTLTPSEAAVVSVTMLRAGESMHAIPNVATLKGTVRTFSNAVTDLIEQRIREIAAGVSGAAGARCIVTFDRKCAPTVNHPDEARFAAQAFAALAGEGAVKPFTPSMAAEDFSFMLEAKAGAYFMIGNGDGDHRNAGGGAGPCVLHNPSYDFNDALIPIGAQAWTALALAWLARR
ncbi:MAG: amidohydrolase, partial [Caulobacterales bacterium]